MMPVADIVHAADCITIGRKARSLSIFFEIVGAVNT